ncbi:hypothetical protein DSL92_06585 [Billgrantia gudaonensis]|uniref:Uncharacterized protein n=1 Tax=Billgrantia gudaonensis TaxID=376427 RepID=A0A3S0R4V1_9GAMM|nr:hypothetical protein DSL92_06585 [Halomonas gudaonensis]
MGFGTAATTTTWWCSSKRLARGRSFRPGANRLGDRSWAPPRTAQVQPLDIDLLTVRRPHQVNGGVEFTARRSLHRTFVLQ